MEKHVLAVQTVITAVAAYISAKLGILGPLLIVLISVMVLDYFTGLLASKKEGVEHPDDPEYGWSSKKGAQGIIKKVGYMCMIAVAIVLDYIIVTAAKGIGIGVPPATAVFALLVTVWYILNELLSITENAGRMGAPIPEWIRKYIAALKEKIDNKAEEETPE